MPTLNISLPDALRDHVEARAEAGSYTTSEYIRQLIREDKARHELTEYEMLRQLLAISAKQLDDGEGVEIDVETMLSQGRARRAAQARRAAE